MPSRLPMLVAVALALAIPFAGRAQSVGVKGGWSHSTVAGPIDAGAPGLNSFATGAFLEVPVSRILSLQAEVLRVRKGTGDSLNGVQSTFAVTYTEFPLLAKVRVPLRSSPIKPNVFAGPYLAVKGSCKVENAGALNSSLSCGDLVDVSNTDVGLTFGGGVGLPLTSRLDGLVEARYDLGLKSLSATTPPSDNKNRSFILFAGFSIPIGSRGKGTTTRALPSSLQ